MVSYGINSKFFISCSQRWQHKRHDLIIRAFTRFLKNNPSAGYQMVFTGNLEDYRNPSYKQYIQNLIDDSGLNNKILSLGMIDRSDQIHLISLSEALVQASYFEGGPGASGMLEAASLSRPIIASDIEPNLEFEYSAIRYFTKDSIDSLVERFEEFVNLRSKMVGFHSTSFDSSSFDSSVIEAASGYHILRQLSTIADGWKFSNYFK
jgi:glycosyltransferase involved in cell wall biosynthesis